MEGVVAKRCLRGMGSHCDDKKEHIKNINNLYNRTKRDNKTLKIKEEKIINKYILKTKIKLWIQLINVLLILSLVIIINMLDIMAIDNNKIIKIIKTEYKKEYSKNQIFEILGKYTKTTTSFVLTLVPDKIENMFKETYKEFIKKENVKNIEDNKIEIYTETPVGDNTNKGKLVESEPKYIESVSAVSTIDLNADEIKKKKITFLKPTSGTITSRFGARDQVFNDVESYHTGIDIANKEGTKINSSTDGKVIKVSENQYNGKFVEIEIDSVILKYLHMSKVEVIEGSIVRSGDLVGLMGTTGVSTGPHLHFEIVINNVKIDPEKLISF